ncbi:hypothetical protein EJP82_26740 [Paenibacillus anaericanus]|uniref:Uncharacterized protein n=1 Tax=Paenibacillus anaericanus TaxID=170367 RepID=A0A433XVT2_9BACL|nr:hypothetical protein [Paenibacillus anaericanus]RUT38713.1 hypothetical protein EJP82_26740 [Paenibacillus anaericanus]
MTTMIECNETFDGKQVFLEDRGDEFVFRYDAWVEIEGPNWSHFKQNIHALGKTAKQAISKCKKSAEKSKEENVAISIDPIELERMLKDN